MMTRREILALLALLAARPAFGQGISSRGVKPQPRGKPSGRPFNARFTDVAKQAREMWVHVYGEFRDWKAGRREERRKQLETTDGRRQMLVEEREFVAARMADFIAAL